MDFNELHSMVSLYAKARRPQMTAEAKAWRHEFLSWKSIKVGILYIQIYSNLFQFIPFYTNLFQFIQFYSN